MKIRSRSGGGVPPPWQLRRFTPLLSLGVVVIVTLAALWLLVLANKTFSANSASGLAPNITVENSEISNNNPSQIQILLIADEESRERYAGNIKTFECYGRLLGYDVKVTDVSHACKDSVDGFFFQKHCTVLEIMASSPPTVRRFVVLDADNAVVNPRHRIEDYVDLENGRDLVLYLRFHNNEVAAGNYIVENTEWSRAFLEEWMNLHPGRREVHGYSGMNQDNGALHWLLLHRLASKETPGWKECVEVGRKGWVGRARAYEAFVSCFHKVLKRTGCEGRDWDHVKILPRGKAWTVDGWPVKYKWSRDTTFMHHAKKNPPLAGDRVVTDFECDASFLTRTDENEVSAEALEAEFAAAAERKRKASPDAGWDDRSCVQTMS